MLHASERLSIEADLAWAFGLTDGARIEDVRPIASAPSIGEVVASLRSGPSARVRRRLVTELEALVATGSHRRARRQERKRLLAEIVLLFDLEAILGSAPAHDLDARLSSVHAAVRTILDRAR